MKSLYHFTCFEGLIGIIIKRVIQPGRAVATNSSIEDGYAVCMTTDLFPVGHGIPDGREISFEDAQRLGNWQVHDGRYFSPDRTAVRVKIDIPSDDERLIYVPDLLGSSSLTLLGLDFAGYIPCKDTQIKDVVSDVDLLEMFSLLASGSIDRKSPTWWYYRGEIPFDWITEISVKTQEFEYVSKTSREILDLLEAMICE
jgi:hypothetical protein